jgi:hypothetical protein
MLFFESEVSLSKIEGLGLFAMENIPGGSVVGNLSSDCIYMSEKKYNEAQIEGDPAVIQSGIRMVKSIFMINNPSEDNEFLYKNEDYLNHSQNPTLLYHCGILFALRDIQPGEELTVDYKYFFSVVDVTSFIDRETGRQVRGLTGNQALLESTQALTALLSLPIASASEADRGAIDSVTSRVAGRRKKKPAVYAAEARA